MRLFRIWFQILFFNPLLTSRVSNVFNMAWHRRRRSVYTTWAKLLFSLSMQSLYILSPFFLSSPTAHFLCYFLQYAVKVSRGYLRFEIVLTLPFCVRAHVIGVNSLCQSLSANPFIPSSLVHLDLSGNILRGDDMQVHAHGHAVSNPTQSQCQ